MPHDRLDLVLSSQVSDLISAGTAKGSELVIEDLLPPEDGLGPRYILQGSDRRFLRMNSNSYLGISAHPSVVDAGEQASAKFGAGPGAVRFISGTFAPHTSLERKLAGFHSRPSATIYSSAYATVVSALTSLVTPETVVLSDALNHNCIINGLRMARPKALGVYGHLDYEELDFSLTQSHGKARRAMIVTDGVFSMRGDFADLGTIGEIARSHDAEFEENVALVVDDSHGVGAYGATGRGTEEVTDGEADVLIGTLGKAFGVNGGYLAASKATTDFLRERGPMYIYSNPITVGEAAAAEAAVALVDTPEGSGLLTHLSRMTSRFETGLTEAGMETIPGPHPVVPLMVRDTNRTARLVEHLFEEGILATGLNFPVVPKGDEEIRFQVNANHTEADIDFVLDALSRFAG